MCTSCPLIWIFIDYWQSHALQFTRSHACIYFMMNGANNWFLLNWIHVYCLLSAFLYACTYFYQWTLTASFWLHPPRTLERQPMQFESCLWPRPKGIWRMFLPTNKPFRSLASVVELGELLRQRTATQMVKDVGLLNLQDLFLIYLRMLRVMQKYVFCSTDCAFPLFFLLHLSLTDAILLSCSSGERLGCRHSLHISHPGKPSSKAEASDVPCSWKNQPWVLACRYWWACIAVYHAQFITSLLQLTCHRPAILSWLCLRRKNL